MTICERCGGEREGIPNRCPACGFEPKTLKELATAAILTTEFEAGEKTYGTPEPILHRTAAGIRAGQAATIDAAELNRHEQAVRRFLGTTDRDLIMGLWAQFRPAVFLIGGLLVFALLMSWCSHR